MIDGRPNVARALLATPLKWAGLASWALVSAACLVPQDATYIDPAPAQVNRPPRILENLVEPPRKITTVDRTGCLLEFSVSVWDDDVDQPIFANWFIDYGQNTRPLFDSRTLPADTKRQRGTPARGVLHLNEEPQSRLGLHVVEVDIADGQEDVIKRELVDPADRFLVSYSWVLDVKGPCE